jgi:hypothetical protein
MGLFPELSKFSVSYGQYHNDMVNKLIHMVCIPAIIFTAANLLQFDPMVHELRWDRKSNTLDCEFANACHVYPVCTLS